MKKSERIQIFVKEYLKDLNATQAAIRAGYSEKTARAIGSKLLTKVDIQEEIQRAMNERQQRLNIEADEVVQHIAQIAFATPEDFRRWADYSPKVSDKIRALEMLMRHITVFGDRVRLEKSREILAGFKAGDTDAREAAIDFAMIPMPLPEVLKIELQKVKEPDSSLYGNPISDEELDRITADAKAKALAWKEDCLPERRANVARLEQELTGDNPKLLG